MGLGDPSQHKINDHKGVGEHIKGVLVIQVSIDTYHLKKVIDVWMSQVI